MNLDVIFGKNGLEGGNGRRARFTLDDGVHATVLLRDGGVVLAYDDGASPRKLSIRASFSTNREIASAAMSINALSLVLVDHRDALNDWRRSYTVSTLADAASAYPDVSGVDWSDDEVTDIEESLSIPDPISLKDLRSAVEKEIADEGAAVKTLALPDDYTGIGVRILKDFDPSTDEENFIHIAAETRLQNGTLMDLDRLLTYRDGFLLSRILGAIIDLQNRGLVELDLLTDDAEGYAGPIPPDNGEDASEENADSAPTEPEDVETIRDDAESEIKKAAEENIKENMDESGSNDPDADELFRDAEVDIPSSTAQDDDAAPADVPTVDLEDLPTDEDIAAEDDDQGVADPTEEDQTDDGLNRDLPGLEDVPELIPTVPVVTNEPNADNAEAAGVATMPAETADAVPVPVIDSANPAGAAPVTSDAPESASASGNDDSGIQGSSRRYTVPSLPPVTGAASTAATGTEGNDHGSILTDVLGDASSDDAGTGPEDDVDKLIMLIARAKKRMESLTARYDDLVNRIDSLPISELDSARVRVSSIQASIEDREEKVAELRREIDGLHGDLDKATSDADELEKTVALKPELEMDRDETKRKIDSIRFVLK